MYFAQPGPARLRTWPRRARRVLWAHAVSVACTPIPRIRRVIPGADPQRGSGEAAIYVSFDRHGLVADYVVTQVAALAASGRRVIFISNSRKLPQQGTARLLPHVREVVHRRNYGHDFGAFKDGIARLGDLAALGSLILMNDSCYGPFSSLAHVTRAAAASGNDIFGITESWAHGYHLQTYFIWIGQRALVSAAFARFWRRLLLRQPRDMVITRGEIRLTQDMLKAGFRAGALCPYETLARLGQEAAMRRLAEEPDAMLPEERRHYQRMADYILGGVPLNPTHFFWDILIRDFGCPFIKRELLQKNPVAVPGLLGWHGVLPEPGGIDLEAIRNHLKLR